MVLVAVEVSCDPARLSDVETVAVQWAQDMRFRVVCAGAEATAAAPVVLPGSLLTLADAFHVTAETIARVE